MSNTRSLADILSEIRTANANGTVFTVEQLRTLVSQASAEFRGGATDAITLLYSGDMPDGTHAWQIADEVVAANSPGSVKTLSKTSVDVAELIEDDDFKNALRASVAKDMPTGTPSSVVEARVSEIVNGSTVNGERMADGLWDDASRRFAQNASGDIRIIAPGGPKGSETFEFLGS